MRYYRTQGLAFLIPILVIVGIFYGMIVWNFVVAFTGWQGLQATWKFVGFYNFSRLFSLQRFWVNIGNNLRWLLFFIAPTVFGGFVLAYLLNNLGRGEKIL